MLEQDELKRFESWLAPGNSPALPFVRGGKVYYTGWDCAGYWAMDSAGNFFADFSAHSCSLRQTTAAVVLREIENSDTPNDAHELRIILGMLPRLPGWMAVALAHGWTPPSDFDRSKYE